MHTRDTRALTRRRLALALAATTAAIGPALAQRPAFKLIMVGDSLVAGYGLARADAPPAQVEAQLRARGIAARVVNAGASGETSADIAARLDFSVPMDADGVLLAVGGNDLLQGLAPAQLEANLRAMVRRLKARGTQVALAGLRAPANLGPDYGRRFAAAYATVAKSEYVPLYPFLLDGVALDPALNQADRIHPNAAGARVMAQRLTPFLIEAFRLG